MTKAKLYRLTQVDKETGTEIVLYGHATANVMTQYWEAYTDQSHYVKIEEVDVDGEANTQEG